MSAPTRSRSVPDRSRSLHRTQHSQSPVHNPPAPISFAFLDDNDGNDERRRRQSTEGFSFDIYAFQCTASSVVVGGGLILIVKCIEQRGYLAVLVCTRQDGERERHATLQPARIQRFVCAHAFLFTFNLKYIASHS